MNMQYIRAGDSYIINPVCALCRDHERNGFVHGVQVGVRLAQEIQNVPSAVH